MLAGQVRHRQCPARMPAAPTQSLGDRTGDACPDDGGDAGARALCSCSRNQPSSDSNVSPGQTLTVTSHARPSACARCQWRDMFSASGPLAPKCVHSSGPSRRHCRRGRPRAASSPPDAPRRRAVRQPSNSSGASAGVVDTCRDRAAARARSRSRRCRSSAATARRSPAPRRATVNVRRRRSSCDHGEADRPSASHVAVTRSPVDDRHRPADRPRSAARRAPCASDWCRETACRLPPRAAPRRAPRRSRRRAPPETRAARGGRRAASRPRNRAR